MELHGAIRKSDIPAVAALAGTRNAEPLDLAGEHYERGTLQVSVFRGRLDTATGLYRGTFEVRRVDPDDCADPDLVDLSALSGWIEDPAPEPQDQDHQDHKVLPELEEENQE